MTPRHKDVERNGVMQTTRQQLLMAAAGEFSSHGFDKANVNRIAKAAGYAIGTVYNYFPNKRELMHTFIDETAQAHVGYIVEEVKREPDLEKRLEAFFRAGFNFVVTNLTPAKAIFNALNGPDQQFKERLFTAYQPLFQLLNDDIIQPGINQSLFRKVDTQSTSSLLMLIYLGTASQLSPAGTPWLDHTLVADFVLNSLKIKKET